MPSASPIVNARFFAILAVLAPIALIGCGQSDEEVRPFSGTRRSPAPVLDVSLPTTDNTEFQFVADEDHVLLVYFGYTSCPDICPTTLSDVGQARAEFGDDEDRIDLAMVTVDPARDTADILSSYVAVFVPDATAIRTEDGARLKAAADAFGVYYSVDEIGPDEFEVAHSGTIFAIDDTGRLTASWPFGAPASDIANDLRMLLDEASDGQAST